MNTTDLAVLANNPAIFRNGLRIATGRGVVNFGEVLQEFQQADFTALDPGWQRCMGRATQGGYSRAWLERCRGGSKTSDLAVMVVYQLAFAQQEVRGLCAAVDAEQAGLIRNAI